MTMRSKLAAAAAIAALAAAGAAQAASINVLWYTGGVQTDFGPTGTYQTDITNLATPTAGDPSSATWNITFWSGGAMPAGSFNVLVIASPEGGWGTDPNYAALSAGGVTLGDRLMVTGQDADWHYLNSPGPTNFNGPQGFLRDAINWAGDGTGMGLVALGPQNGETYLADIGVTGLGAITDVNNNTVDIPPAFASFPINSDLTNAGLSNWDTSAHAEFNSSDSTIWTPINVDGAGGVITLVTEGGAGSIVGGGGPVPEPATWALMLVGVGALGASLRAKRSSGVATA